MAGYSLRRDQLWHFALQLAEDETKSMQFAQHYEEHGHLIHLKYNQLVSNLSCLGDIVAKMYQEKKLTLKELEHIQHLQSTPIRANEELLNIIARKPRDAYGCFLALTKTTNQLHLYQMLVSGDDTCSETNGGDTWEHKDLICRNFIWLSEKLNTDIGLISLLYQEDVLTAREREHIFCISDTFQKNEFLLGLLSKKSPKDFDKFLSALENLGQGHVATKLKTRKESSADHATAPPTVKTSKYVFEKLSPKALSKFGQKPVPVCSFTKPVPPPKPGAQSTTVQLYTKSTHIVAKNTEKPVHFRRTEVIRLKLNELESQLQTEIAIKVTSLYLLYLDKPEDELKMFFGIILQECHKIKKETVTGNFETNMQLEQLKKNASQFSAATLANDVIRAQLHSMQQELTSERFRSNEEQIQLEEKVFKLKNDIHHEKAKCRRLEDEKLLNNTVIMEIEDRLKKAECDKQCLQQQMREINARLASTEYKLQKSKQTFEESNIEMILLGTERDELKKECEILKTESETINELKVQLLEKQENNVDLVAQLEGKERTLMLAEKEKLDLIKTQKETSEAKALEGDRILKLGEELESEQHRRQELENKLSFASAQLEQLIRPLEGINIKAVTHESLVIRNNHQFLVENLDSNGLIALLHSKNCITDEEREYLCNQPYRFYKNDELLHWMRTMMFKEDKGLRVLECLREAEENFVVDLLEKGGVLIKSKISTKLMKERQHILAKSSSEKVVKLKEKEVMVVEKLNQAKGVSLSSSEIMASKPTDEQTVIVPYCRQEDNGIVMWFWCQSTNAQRDLQSMYASGMLLEKLVTIFEQFSNDNVSNSSELLIPINITIFLEDFTKYKKKVDFKTDPKLLLTIRPKAVERNHTKIFALAVLANEIFVVTRKNCEIEVYNKTSLHFERSLIVDNLEEPRDIVSCSRKRCLYVVDGKSSDQPMEIIRVDVTGSVTKKLWRGNDWGRLSITDESNIILTVLDKRKLLEITPSGQLVHEITLDVLNPWHAVKLSSDRIVVTYGETSGGRVCIIDNKGKVIQSIPYTDLSTSILTLLPINVVVNRDGSFLVADETGGRILLLSSTLEYRRKFVTRKHGLEYPRKIFVDESNCRLLVCNNSGNGGRILVFDISD